MNGRARPGVGPHKISGFWESHKPVQNSLLVCVTLRGGRASRKHMTSREPVAQDFRQRAIAR